MLLGQVKGRTLGRARPLGNKAQPRNDCEPLAVGMVDYQIVMGPVVATGATFHIGPGKIFDDPGGTQLAYHLQRALDLPRFDLIGQAGMDPNLGINRRDRALRPKLDRGAKPGAPQPKRDPNDKCQRDERAHDA